MSEAFLGEHRFAYAATGYLKLDSIAATCHFQLVSEHYEKGSIILISNKSYGNRKPTLRSFRFARTASA